MVRMQHTTLADAVLDVLEEAAVGIRSWIQASPCVFQV